MQRLTTAGRLRPAARALPQALRQFLTPEVYRQAHQARAAAKACPRWATQPLVLTLLVLTWCCGDSQPERFETAKAFCAACRSKRRRPGRTVQGFQKALAKLPMAALRAVAAGVRRRLAALIELSADGFIALGCDGSRLECPRAAPLERRLGCAAKEGSAPTIWVTALVHLRTGLLWAWRLGKGTAAERDHLVRLLPTLPAGALLVADAGFNGYGLAQAIVAAGASFLIRASGKDSLYVEAAVPAEGWSQGRVYLWPQEAQRKGQPPLPCRLIRVRGPHQRDVWLLTDVLEAARLPAAVAARYYRWRWENEGLFRTYKRTLAKVKLHSRTVALVHREAEGSLLATQLLLAQGALAVPGGQAPREPVRCSARKVLLAVRAGIEEAIRGRLGPRPRASYRRRLEAAKRERRPRTTPKQKRAWPRRVAHKPLKAPRFLVLTERLKALMALRERIVA
jgi:Transposase DDE domain